MKHLVKNGRKIIGFVYLSNGQYWYAFGKPSQFEYIAFACDSIEAGRHIRPALDPRGDGHGRWDLLRPS